MTEQESAHVRWQASVVADNQMFAGPRNTLGALIVLGDLLTAIAVPLALRPYVSWTILVTWSALVLITSYGREVFERAFQRSIGSSSAARRVWAWGSGVVWGALPWMAFGSLDNPTVVWIAVVVAIFGIGTDMFYVSLTDTAAFDPMVVAYGASNVIAFLAAFEFLAAGSLLITGAIFLSGTVVWTKVRDELIDKRIESDRRTKVDALTGLGTRAAAAEAIERLQASDATQIHCAFIDVDDFKHLNDNHGYSVGDRALIEIGRTIRGELPDDWTIARFGGDEFVAVGSSSVDLQNLVDTEISVTHDTKLTIAQSLSIGVTTLPAAQADSQTLFREAASALRFSKRLGKHQVLEMTDELREIEASRVQLGNKAGDALRNREITPWAQRIIDLHSGATVGLELLARWERPDGTIIPPNDFIPVIEDRGLGPDLGLQMITNAIEALADPSMRNRATFITVNISARHLYHRRLPAEILTLLGRHAVGAERLVLEITESQHLPSSPIWLDTANQLRTLGIGLAMDDFGAGYSSMEQLLEVPFTHVKLDRAVTQAVDRPGAIKLSAAIAAMASGAGMTTVAEGIENETQRVAMQGAGFNYGQGFHFHRPEPLAEVMEDLAAQPPADKLDLDSVN